MKFLIHQNNALSFVNPNPDRNDIDVTLLAPIQKVIVLIDVNSILIDNGNYPGQGFRAEIFPDGKAVFKDIKDEKFIFLDPHYFIIED
ncbi:MAG: hypothetical protein KG003_00970 [Bacteroidetes bacterium]|nr:hypothetical protein [Bacteroidota bacterium]